VQKINNILQVLGIPYSALISIIFVMMLLSFPIGAYIMFNSDVGKDITFEYPLENVSIFLVGIAIQLPIEFEIGDAFIVVWCTTIILFSIAIIGPKNNFLKTLSSIVSYGKHESYQNYMIATIHWFTVLIIVSGIINFVQEEFGITTYPPESANDLIQFFYVTAAPFSEEIGFRVMLIGLPLFAIFSHKTSIRIFAKILWHPKQGLEFYEIKRVMILIIIVSVFFGIAHIISGEAWSAGKFAQATVSGIIIGWVYFRHGLIPAILVHWATNYFIFSYVYFISDINNISISSAFSHSLTGTLETLLVVTGLLSITILVVNYISSKKEKQLEI